MRNKRIVYIIGAVLVVLLAIGAVKYRQSYNSNPQNKTTSVTGTSSNNAIQTTKNGVVLIEQSTFSPATITIAKGDTVTWQNKDPYLHRIVADDGSFDLGDQRQGETVKHTFTEVGTYTYTCSIHAFMKGTVVVK